MLGLLIEVVSWNTDGDVLLSDPNVDWKSNKLQVGIWDAKYCTQIIKIVEMNKITLSIYFSSGITFLSNVDGWGKTNLCTEETVAANITTCCETFLS